MAEGSLRYAAREEEFGDLATVVLHDRETDLVATIVPAMGSNVISLARPSAGIRYFFSPSSAAELKERPTRFGHPVLLPPNRIWEGRFTFAGRTYRLPINRPPHHIHGLVYSLPWRLLGRGADEKGAWARTAFVGRDHPSFTAVFPQDFRLELLFTLREGALRVTAEATNQGPEPFPFGLGYHTYFRLPMKEGEEPGDYRLSLPAQARWELKDCFPTGRLLPLSEEEKLVTTRVTDLRLDDVFTELAPGEPEIVARLSHEPSGRGIAYASGRGFPHWVVWTGPAPGAPFICLEPYSWVTNAPNLPLPASLTGVVSLAAGKSWREWVEFRPFGPVG
ncbi:MAG: aldose 1-epimerase [Firmicutes bacterium]|nr:aldose 1-epimerase [Bacillota bacterium]